MSEGRLFFAAMPPPQVIAGISETLARHGLDRLLGAALFAPGNWHQSLSERVFNPSRADIALLRAVGDKVRAHACTLLYNRIESSVTPKGKVYVTLRAQGHPKAFKALNQAVREPLQAAGYGDIATGVTPHTTLSYDAPGRIDKIVLDPPLHWTVDELLLVQGGGAPYRYEVLDRWPLLPELNPVAAQASLF